MSLQQNISALCFLWENKCSFGMTSVVSEITTRTQATVIARQAGEVNGDEPTLKADGYFYPRSVISGKLLNLWGPSSSV